MSFRTTLRLLAAVCALGFAVWFIDNRSRLGEPTGSGGKVLGIVSEAVDWLTIEHGDFNVVCSRKNGKWFIDNPLSARADEGRVNRILNVLEMLPRDEVITPAERASRDLSLLDYGLDPPRARFIVRGQVFRRELLVGRDAPLGDSIYVKLRRGEGVIATSRSVLEMIPENLDLMRDPTVVYGETARTHRLEIQRPGVGFIQLAQAADGWVIQQPIVARADQARVTRMLDALYSLKVEKFVWDERVEKADDAPPDSDAGAQEELYDLVPDKAPARIGVWVARDRVGRELVLGKQVAENEGLTYAKLRDAGSIYAVGRNILDVFSVTVDDLRDRRVFPLPADAVKYACFEDGDRKLVLLWNAADGWLITEPVRWKADDRVVADTIARVLALQVETFHGESTNLAAVGLAPPAFAVQILAAAPAQPAAAEEGGPAATGEGDAAPGRPGRLLVAAMNPKDTAVYAKLDDDPAVCTLLAGPVRALVTGLTDPLVYRDRTVLAAPAAGVKRISQERSGARLEVTRDESGAWTASVPATNVVDVMAVENILFHSSNMRAIRIESHNPDSLAVYGLDRPAFTLTLGLAGDQGIQRSLMMGFRSKTDGIYAMVQGRDVVFVLSTELVDELMNDVSAPPGKDRNEPVGKKAAGPPG